MTFFKNGWDLLEPQERREAGVVLVVIVISALSATAMVGAIMPFLTVLSDQSLIRSQTVYRWLYTFFGFQNDYAFVIALGIGAICIILFANVIQVVRVVAVTRFATMQVHKLSCRLLSAYLHQPYAFFLSRNTSELSTQIFVEAREAVDQFYRPAVDALASLFTILALVGLLLWIEPIITFTAFAIIGTFYGGAYMLSSRVATRLGDKRAAANAARFRHANEALTTVKNIKLLGREQAYINRFEKPSKAMAQSLVTISVTAQTPRYVMHTIAFGGLIAISLILLDPTTMNGNGALNDMLPTLSVFALAGQRMIPELSKLYHSIIRLRFGRSAIDRIYTDITASTSANPTGTLPTTPLVFKDKLVLNDIGFVYDGAERTALTHISLTIKAGETIGIVGSSGSGKSTLVDVLLGLLAPTSGTLTVDDHIIDATNLRSWQRALGYVPQELMLSDGTVAENIAMGCSPEEIDHARVQTVAKSAQIDQFVEQDLDDGYQTHIGDRGLKLSGGQKQRIGIARALYHDAQVLVLDEATSALDSLTEQNVMGSIHSYTGQKTIILVAHRLATLKECDKIIVMEKGQLVHCGSWYELSKDSAIFANMLERQQS